jgi:nucleoside-diphosphate-sugar epimerase
MKRKILLSGSTGFLGSNLHPLLSSMGYEIHCISRQSSRDKITCNLSGSLTYHFFDSNCQLKSIFEGFKFDLFINCSTLYIAEHKTEDIESLLETNIDFPCILLDILTTNGLKNFINIGSSWENYQGVEGNPVNFYAATKISFENIVKYFEEVSGMCATTLYITDTYGPNDSRCKLINTLLNCSDQEINLSPGDQLIDLLHIKDVCRAIIILVKLIIDGQPIARRYQISSSEKLSLRDLVRLISILSNKKIPVNFGGRPYRKREVMIPSCIYEQVPEWYQNIDLINGLSELIKNEK